MKRFLIYLILVSLSLSLSADDRNGLTAEQEEIVHNELRELHKTMQQAMNDLDIDTIVANVNEDVVFSTMNGDVIHGKDELRAYYEKMMLGDNKIVESVVTNFMPDDLSILVEDDVAIASGRSDDHYKLAIGKKINVKPIWSTTLTKRDNVWKIANFHYSVNMFDNPILKAQGKFVWILAAGSLLLSLFTFLIGRRMRKTSH